MSDLDPYGVSDTLSKFLLFLKRTDDVLALSLVYSDSAVCSFVCVVFSACWRQANVTPIPSGPLSSSVANYRSTSLTSVLSYVFESLVSIRLGLIMERSGVLPTTKFGNRKVLGTCNALCACPQQCKMDRRVGRKLGSCRLFSVYWIDFSALWYWRFCVVYIDTVLLTQLISRFFCRLFPWPGVRHSDGER